MQNSFLLMASGQGSNAEVLADLALEKNYALKGLITDNIHAGVIERFKSMGIPVWIIPFPGKEKGSLSQRRDLHAKALLEKTSELCVDWVFLAGFMKILSPIFLKSFYDEKLKAFRVINIHPSLLPLFKGNKPYEEAFDSLEKESGVTIHFVDEGVDTGEIILQKKMNKIENENFEDFKKRGLALEHRTYPLVLKAVMENDLGRFSNEK